MKTYKRIRYDSACGNKTAMQVLHTFLPELHIRGFERGRTYIFEDNCLARIKYVRKSRQNNRVQSEKLRRLFAFNNDNTPIAITLEINIRSDEHIPRLFHIYSKLQQTESLAS